MLIQNMRLSLSDFKTYLLPSAKMREVSAFRESVEVECGVQVLS
jgi:hypothetical protein